MACVLQRVPVIERSDCITLFSQPGARGLRCSPLLDMWRHNLSPGLWETESDIDTPFWTVPSISSECSKSVWCLYSGQNFWYLLLVNLKLKHVRCYKIFHSLFIWKVKVGNRNCIYSHVERIDGFIFDSMCQTAI